jgi:trehalose 6-phosphate phosphatase
MTDPTGQETLASTLSTLSERLVEADELVLCTDFDGTLAPIVERPDEASIRSENRELLRQLSDRLDVTVAVVSGRQLADVRERVGLAGPTYAGNHGLELDVGGEDDVHPDAAACESSIAQICATLEDAFEDEDGVVVEEKGPTATIHYRRAPADRAAEVREIVANVVEQFTDDELEVHDDREVVEIRPDVDWDKGHVASLFAWDSPARLPVFVGDGQTDEAGFREVRDDGVAIRVGDPDGRETKATEHLTDPVEVTTMLRWLVETGTGLLERDGHVGAGQSKPSRATTTDCD